MRRLAGMIVVSGLLIAGTAATAQPPGGGGPNSDGGDDLVTRMMKFDKNKDGKLTKSEVTDERVQRLYDRADANKDGVVTKEELTALAAREQRSNSRGGPRGFGGPGGGGPGGPGGGFGFGGPGGGPGGPPPRPGEILPSMLQQRLNLTAAQKTKLADLQKEVDAKLAKILDDDQAAQLKQMRQRGPGGGPPGGGPPGGGPPPDGDEPPPPRDRF